MRSCVAYQEQTRTPFVVMHGSCLQLRKQFHTVSLRQHARWHDNSPRFLPPFSPRTLGSAHTRIVVLCLLYLTQNNEPCEQLLPASGATSGYERVLQLISPLPSFCRTTSVSRGFVFGPADQVDINFFCYLSKQNTIDFTTGMACSVQLKLLQTELQEKKWSK